MASWRDAVGAASVLIPSIAIWISLRKFTAGSRTALKRAMIEHTRNEEEAGCGNSLPIPNLVYRELHAGSSPPDLPLWRSAFSRQF